MSKKPVLNLGSSGSSDASTDPKTFSDFLNSPEVKRMGHAYQSLVLGYYTLGLLAPKQRVTKEQATQIATAHLVNNLINSIEAESADSVDSMVEGDSAITFEEGFFRMNYSPDQLREIEENAEKIYKDDRKVGGIVDFITKNLQAGPVVRIAKNAYDKFMGKEKVAAALPELGSLKIVDGNATTSYAAAADRRDPAPAAPGTGVRGAAARPASPNDQSKGASQGSA